MTEHNAENTKYEDVGMFDCSCDKKRFYVLNVNSAININNINLVN